nr:hypothetical protein [Tanacetum cinerariifolium]
MSIRMMRYSANERGVFVQLGKGKGTWGGRVEAFWNSSRVLQVHRKGKWGGLVLAGMLGKWVLFGRLGYWGLAGLVLQVLNSCYFCLDTKEVSDIFVAPCFVNGLEEYDGEINLGVEENMISNEFAVNLCLDHEVKSRNKVVNKELIVALRGGIYFVKFILNPEEDDVEPWVGFGRSFLRLTKAIADLETRTITIYPELDLFLFVCKMEKNSRNKRKQLENYKLTYSDMGPSMSTRKPLTLEEAKREALAISIYEIYSLLEEERPVIETMPYSDKYKKILDGTCLNKMKLDGTNKEEEEAITKVKGEALIENEDLRAFVIPIRLESMINLSALADTGLDINVMPYRVYKEMGREEV